MTRPRLLSTVAVRRHLVNGAPQIVLHAPLPARATAVVGEREWAFLAAADGTRDLAGIRLAAGRGGRLAAPEHIALFFAQLREAGLLEPASLDSAPHPAEPRSEAAASSDGSAEQRPLVGMPGFALRCDGSGTCCRVYPTTTFLPLDVARARSACPDIHDVGHHPERLFTPVGGAQATSWEPSAVLMQDGRCAFLDHAGSCQIHARVGAEHKPSGCRMFPTRYVDDGAVVRVVPSPECRCVLTSPPVATPTPAGPPISAVIDVVPNPVQITATTTWTRAAYLAWAERSASLLHDTVDGVTALWDLAAAIESDDVSLLALAAALAPVLDAHNAHQRWRHPSDLARRVPRWMARALDFAEVPVAPAPHENLYLRAVAFGHAWALDEGVPLVMSLRERALRLFVARRLRMGFSAEDLDDPDRALDEPIALVEACVRAFALRPG